MPGFLASTHLKALCADEAPGVPGFLAAVDDLLVFAESFAALRTTLIATAKAVLVRLRIISWLVKNKADIQA